MGLVLSRVLVIVRHDTSSTDSSLDRHSHTTNTQNGSLDHTYTAVTRTPPPHHIMCTVYTATHRLLAFQREISLFHFRSSTDKCFGRRSDDGNDDDGATTPNPGIETAAASAVSEAVSETVSETAETAETAADRAPMGSWWWSRNRARRSASLFAALAASIRFFSLSAVELVLPCVGRFGARRCLMACCRLMPGALNSIVITRS